MAPMLKLFLAPLASAALAAGQASLPAERDIAEAYTDYSAEHCRRLIDQCVPMHATSAEAIRDLTCRRIRNGIARCRFAVGLDRCEARLTARDDGQGVRWTARDFSTAPWRLRVRCRPN